MQRLLNRVCWNFSKQHYASQAEFEKAVTEYNTAILADKSEWQPEQVVINSPEVLIGYEAWLKSPSDLLPNDTLEEGESFWKTAKSDGGYYQADLVARLKADNKQSFSALELLYKLQQQLANKELGDHVFFEGLVSEGSNNGIPSFYLYCGS